MMRRCPTSLAVLGALLALGFGTQPMFTRADSINPNASTATAGYRLSSDAGLPAPAADINGPQVQAIILPPGSVIPPKLSDGTEGSPLTILPDSHGFDPNHLVVALKDTQSASGQPQQMFGLVFYGQGFQPGGLLHFTLSIDKSLGSTPPSLQVLTPGISITADTPADTGGANPGGSDNGVPPVNVPEPLSLVLWSALLGAVVVRGRVVKRSRPS